jgi:hypothetical protein
MGDWLSILAKWCRLPMRSGFAELDLQIEKLRTLRDSYQTSFQKQQHYRADDVTV